MRQSVSNAAACRIVGVNRKTGHRWRYGRSITIRAGEIRTYPAIIRPAHPVSARFLSEAERIAIADGLIRGGSIRVIAAELGRAPSTVSREIRRNRDTGTEVYHPFRAQRRAAGGPAPPARRCRLPLAKSAAAGEGAWARETAAHGYTLRAGQPRSRRRQLAWHVALHRRLATVAGDWQHGEAER